MKIEESLNVTFDETPPPSKTSPLVDDDLDKEEAIKVTEKKNLENGIGDETLEIDELEVYVAQPLGFIDFEKLDHVYKLKKALYGLKQAPKAWYNRLKAFLIKHEYKMGMVDNALFTKKKSSNLIIVQIYVDGIIFDLTCQDICDKFAKIMHDEFEMSMMGELNFFLRLQIKQMEDDIFFNQSKYIKEILKKFGLKDSKPMKTPMSSDTKLTKDEECESVDSTKYRGMIGSLLYLTASRPDILFSVCLCAHFQEAPKTSHLEAVKRIFRYIKGTAHLGLWYPKGTGIETVKQTALAISTTESEYVSAGKACQQALWMKQALIDYDIRLDDVPIIQYRVNYDLEGHMFVEFVIQNQIFSFTLEEFGQIIGIPYNGDCSFSDKWSLDYLASSVPTGGPYQTNPPSPDEIKLYVQEEHEDVVTRIRHDKVIDLEENQILTREITTIMKT
ncbi:retrovirus-related pol polyprotein from transposon TNT 1-94 [Tanacetum coccineum]